MTGNDMLTEIRFWSQVVGDSKRTIVCGPDLESRIKGWIDARGMSGLLKVQPNPACPANQMFIIDEQAIDAGLNEGIQKYRYHS